MVHAQPIMYYRPDRPTPSAFLKVYLKPGASTKKAAAVAESIARQDGLRSHGFSWQDRDVYEADVKVLTRFLCDTGLSGASWTYIPAAATAAAGQQGSGGAGYSAVQPQHRVSTCHLELSVPWRCLQSLTPDATQLADSSWAPPAFQLLPQPPAAFQHPQASTATPTPATPSTPAAPGSTSSSSSSGAPQPQSPIHHHPLLAGLHLAQQGAMAPLRLAVIDVLVATADGASRTPNPAASDPIVAIASHLSSTHEQDSGSGSSGGGTAEGQGTPPGVPRKVVFVLGGSGAAALRELRVEGAVVRVVPGEVLLLAAWRDWLLAADPDVVATFQVGGRRCVAVVLLVVVLLALLAVLAVTLAVMWRYRT